MGDTDLVVEELGVMALIGGDGGGNGGGGSGESDRVGSGGDINDAGRWSSGSKAVCIKVEILSANGRFP